jgi:hypothetical protein
MRADPKENNRPIAEPREYSRSEIDNFSLRCFTVRTAGSDFYSTVSLCGGQVTPLY